MQFIVIDVQLYMLLTYTPTGVRADRNNSEETHNKMQVKRVDVINCN